MEPHGASEGFARRAQVRRSRGASRILQVGRASFLSETKIGPSSFTLKLGLASFSALDRVAASLWIGAWRAILDRGTPSSTGRLLTLPTPAVMSSCSATRRCGGRLAMLSLPTPSPRPPDIISQLIKERAVHGLRRGHDAYSTTSH